MTAHPNIPELAGTYPVVLYFGSQADADEFIALVQAAKPGLVAKSLDPIGGILATGRDVTKELRPDGPVNWDEVERQEEEQIRAQQRRIARGHGNDQY
jgi:hypothetical protein